MRTILPLTFISISSLTAFSQDNQKTEIENPNVSYQYAYIQIKGKAFSKKLNVEVDFGDTPEQLSAGKEYSEVLTNKKSYAAVLNYMAERHFDLVETRDYILTYQGTGDTSGIVFIMRRKK
jgi:hypothetical protein